MKKLLRIILFPLGLVSGLMELTKDGTRDLINKRRYKGAIIDNGCKLNSETILAQNVHIFPNSILNYCKVDSYTYIGSNCLVQNATIGKFCSIARDTFIGLGIHPLNRFSTASLFYRNNNPFKISLSDNHKKVEEYKSISIGHDVWIGARATILDGLTIGHGAVIASGAVVVKDVPPYAIVGGVPAKVLKYRFDEQKIDALLNEKWWEWSLDRIVKEKMNT